MRLRGVLALRIRRTAQVREALRTLLTQFTVHRRGPRPDIALFGSPRSGSTWLTELIAREPHIKPIYEPLRPDKVARAGLPTGFEERLPRWQQKVVSIPPGAEDAYLDYLRRERATRRYGPYDPTGADFHLFTDRRVLNITFGLGIMVWLDEHPQLSFQTVHLLRHPIPSALSRQAGMPGLRGRRAAGPANAFPVRAAANLLDESFVRRYLSPSQVTRCWDLLRIGSPLQRQVLDWCLDNLPGLREAPDRAWLTITYEELVSAPSETIGLLAQRLDLRRPDRLAGGIGMPSRTTTADPPSPTTADARLSAWRRRVDPREERELLGILDVLEIDVYRAGSAFPSPRYRHFTSEAA